MLLLKPIKCSMKKRKSNSSPGVKYLNSSLKIILVSTPLFFLISCGEPLSKNLTDLNSLAESYQFEAEKARNNQDYKTAQKTAKKTVEIRHKIDELGKNKKNITVKRIRKNS